MYLLIQKIISWMNSWFDRFQTKKAYLEKSSPKNYSWTNPSPTQGYPRGSWRVWGECKNNSPHRLDNSQYELPTVSTRRRRFVDFLKPEKQRIFTTIKLAPPSGWIPGEPPFRLFSIDHHWLSIHGNHSGRGIAFLTIHQSYSRRKAPMRRRLDSRLGKIRITRSRRRISSFTRSRELVVRSLARYRLGSSQTAVASSNPFSKTSMAWGAFPSYSSRVWFKRKRAVSRLAASKIPRTLEWISSWRAWGVASQILVMKGVWHRCQVVPWRSVSIAFFKPWWSSEVTKSTPFSPLPFNQMKRNVSWLQTHCHQSGVPELSGILDNGSLREQGVYYGIEPAGLCEP